jgi:hypothetical protein
MTKPAQIKAHEAQRLSAELKSAAAHGDGVDGAQIGPAQRQDKSARSQKPHDDPFATAPRSINSCPPDRNLGPGRRRYSTASLAAGTYNAQIAVSDPAAINNPQTISVTLTISPPGTLQPDFDQDGDVDATDIAHFLACSTGAGLGPPAAGSEDADLDHDVDQSDFSILQRCLSGAGIAADPQCVN